METLQQIIQRKLLEKKTGKITPAAPTVNYRQGAVPYNSLPTAPTRTTPIQATPQEPSLIQRVGNYVSPQPDQVRGIDVVRELPQAALDVISAPVKKLFEFVDKGGAQVLNTIASPIEAVTSKLAGDPELQSMRDVWNRAADNWGNRASEIGYPLEDLFKPTTPGKGMRVYTEKLQEVAKPSAQTVMDKNASIVDKAMSLGGLIGLGVVDFFANPFYLTSIKGLYKGSFELDKPTRTLILQGMANPKEAEALKALGLKQGATTQDIETAYKKIVMNTHPDRLRTVLGRTPTAEEAAIAKGIYNGANEARGFLKGKVKQFTPTEAPTARTATPSATAPMASAAPEAVSARVNAQLPVGQSTTPVINPVASGVGFQMIDSAKAKQTQTLITKLQKTLAERQAVIKAGRATPQALDQAKKLQTTIDLLQKKLQTATQAQIVKSGPVVTPQTTPRPQVSTPLAVAPKEPAITRNIPVQPMVNAAIPAKRQARPEAIAPQIERTTLTTNKVDSLDQIHRQEMINRNNKSMTPEQRAKYSIEAREKIGLKIPNELKKDTLKAEKEIDKKIKETKLTPEVIGKMREIQHEMDVQAILNHPDFKTSKFNKNLEELQAERANRPKVQLKKVESKKRAIDVALEKRREIKKEQKKMDRKYSDMIKERQVEIQKNMEARLKQVKERLDEEKKSYAERVQASMEIQEEKTGRMSEHSVEMEIAKLKQDLADYKKAGRDKQFFQELDFKLYQEYIDGKSKWDKSEIISDFIDKHFAEPEKYDKSISLQSKLLPISEIEDGLNKAWSTMIKWAYKESSGDKIMQALKEALQKSSLVNAIGKRVIYQYKLPDWYKKLKTLAESKQIAGQNTSKELMDYLSEGLTEEQKINLHGAIINHGISSDPDIAARAMVARDILDRFGKQFAEAGGIKMSTFEANKGQYLPRMYYSKELANPLMQWAKSGGMKASLQRAKHRGVIKVIAQEKLPNYQAKGWKKIADSSYKGYIKIRRDYTAEERKAMGEITNEPGYLVARGVSQLSHDSAILEMFKQVAILHPEIISRTPVADFIQLPQSRSYGYLSSKYVDPYIYNDIKGIIEARTFANQLGDKMLSEWKKFKIVDNPATHFRNMYFNFILSDIAGLHPQRADIYGSALLDVWNKTGDYKTANDGGLFGTSYVGAELKDLLLKNKVIKMDKNSKGVYEYSWNEKLGDNILDFGGKLLGYYNKAQAKLGNLYQAEEEWNKMALFKYAKQDLKMSNNDAIEFAKKWGLNYQAVTPWMNKFSQKWYGTPFVRFRMLAAPRIVEGAIFRPFTILKWLGIFAGIEEISRRALDMTKPQLDNLKNNIFPDWMKDGIYILMPEKDKSGNPQFLDLTYIIPYVEDLQGWNAYNYAFGNPMFRIPAEIMLNRSAFTGRDIIDKNLNPELSRQLMGYLGYAYQTIAPPLAPGGYNFDNIYNAIAQKQDYEGKTTDLISQISTSVFGLKLRAIDIPKEQKFRLIELKTKYDYVAGKIRSTLNNKGLNEDARAKEVKRLLGNIEELTNQASLIQNTGKTDEASKLFNR